MIELQAVLQLQAIAPISNAIKWRVDELRRLAKAEIEAKLKKAYAEIERQGLDAQTEVVRIGLGPRATVFLKTLKPVEQVMTPIDVQALLAKPTDKRAQRYLGYQDDD
jgi:hypothetical protein